MSVNHLCEVLFFRSDMLLCPLAWGQQDLSPPLQPQSTQSKHHMWFASF